MPPTNEELGSGLLVPLPRGCPPALAARITCHNQAAATWKARLDTLDADLAALGRAVREQIESRLAAGKSLRAEQLATFAQYRELLAARVALVKELLAVIAEVDWQVIAGMGREIAAAQEKLRRSGWPWRVAGRG